jgi:hypothetical protein
VVLAVFVPFVRSQGDRPAVYPISGRVLVAGAPAVGASVIFHPLGASPDALRPTATVAPDGSFAVGTFARGDGAPAGEYAVTIEWRKLIAEGDELRPGPNVAAPEYAAAASTPLRATVAAGENGEFMFSLATAPVGPLRPRFSTAVRR